MGKFPRGGLGKFRTFPNLGPLVPTAGVLHGNPLVGRRNGVQGKVLHQDYGGLPQPGATPHLAAYGNSTPLSEGRVRRLLYGARSSNHATVRLRPRSWPDWKEVPPEARRMLR
jgi:hypothetical protein